MAKPRNSVIEAYRILAMVAIVAHHYGVHGGVMRGTGGSGTQYFLLGYSSMGKWGVDAFVLIGAYFMSQAPSFRWRGMRSVLIQVWSTSWLILMVALLWLPAQVSTTEAWRAIFPISTNFYWFVTVYVVLMILSPFINILIRAMQRRQHLMLVVILFVIWSVLAIVPGVSLEVNNLGWFVELYLIAAYVARYPIRGSARAWGGAALVFAIIVPLTTAAAGALASAQSQWGIGPDQLRAQHAPFVVLAAVCGFVAVAKMRAHTSRTINLVAGATFGVYLIHDNPFIRRLVWTEWVDTRSAAQEQWLLPLYAVAATVAVYVAATAIELVRQQVVQRPLMAAGDRVFRKRIAAGADGRRVDGSAPPPARDSGEDSPLGS